MKALRFITGYVIYNLADTYKFQLKTNLIFIFLSQKLNNSTLYFFLDCSANVTLVKNGFCNDEVNHIDCNFDGGECCVKQVTGTDFVNKITILIIIIRVHAC